MRRRLARALLAAILISAAVAPASAEATKQSQNPVKLAKARGQSLTVAGLAGVPQALTASPLPPSPASGSLVSGNEDVYSVTMAAGDRLSLSVAGSAGTDFDLYVLWPEATTTIGNYAASAFTTASPEVLAFDAAVAGTYYVSVFAAGADGTYAMTYAKSRASNAARVSRVGGADRYAVALGLSQRNFSAGSSKHVVLASGLKFADALSSSGLAGILGCPLLLSNGTSVTPALLRELSRLGVSQVSIVGGPGSVSEGVRATLEARGYTVVRYGGRDRYAVARNVAKAVTTLNTKTQGRAFLASGEVYADALSASPFAYRKGYPVLLTRASVLPADTSRALSENNVKTVYISGGPASVSPAVSSGVSSRGISVTRIGGANRYEVAVNLANFAITQHWGDPTYIGIASGEKFPDALTGGSITGHRGGVLQLTPGARLGTNCASFVGTWGRLGLVDDCVIYGGPASVSSTTEGRLASILK